MSNLVGPRARIVLAACGGWLCLAALTGCSPEMVKQQQAQDDLAAAMQQAQIGKMQKARQWVDRAIAATPRDINTYIAASNPDDGLSLGIADAGDGEHGVFTSVGDNADVISYMTQAVAKFPNDPGPLLLLEQAQGQMGDTAGQRATAAKLAALMESQLTKPGHQINAGIMDTLAQAYWDAGNQAKGAADYQRVIATYPRDPGAIEARNGLAYAYAVANDTAHLPEALTLAQTALSLAQKQNQSDSSLGAIQDTLGWVQYRLGDFHDALLNIQKGVNSNPRLAEGRYHLAMVYKALGNTAAARIELSYAVRLSQGYAAAQRELQTLPPPSPPAKTADSRA